MPANPVGTPHMSQAAVVDNATDYSSRAMQLLRRHPLISFFLMAYAISWTYVIVFLIVWPLPDTIVTDTPELLGPVVAGFVMTAVMSGRAGVRQLLRRFVTWRVRAVWYLYALVAIPALYLIAVALVPGGAGLVQGPVAHDVAPLSGLLHRRSGPRRPAAGGTGLAWLRAAPSPGALGPAFGGRDPRNHVGRLARTSVLHQDVCSRQRRSQRFGRNRLPAGRRHLLGAHHVGFQQHRRQLADCDTHPHGDQLHARHHQRPVPRRRVQRSRPGCGLRSRRSDHRGRDAWPARFPAA